MPNYKKMYLHLFNAATDAIRLLDNGACAAAKERLVLAQQETEELYISAPESLSARLRELLRGARG